MRHFSKKRRSLTARFLLGGFFLCAVTPLLLLVGLGVGLRLFKPENSFWWRSYDSAAKMAEISTTAGVPADLVPRLEAGLSMPGKKWFDVWIVDAEGRTLSSNTPGSFPLTPAHYLSHIAPKPVVLWDQDSDGTTTTVVRPLHGDARYWMVFRFSYPGSSVEAVVNIIISIVFGVSAAVSLLALGVVLFYFRIEGSKVRRVLADLKRGDLDSRFKVDKVDEIGSLMLTFNEMADEISSLVRKVQAGEKERTELLQYLAHDIRTPLTSLRLVSEELVEDTALKPLARKRAGKLLLQELGFFERMTEDLFFLAQIPQGPESAKEVFSLERLIREEADRVQQLAKSKRRLTLELEAGLELMAREPLFRRLIRNLFENAQKFARKQITLSVKRSGESLEICLQDDGPGFSPEGLESYGKRRPLRYSAGVEKDASVSLGLGSVIVTEVVQNHGGTVRVSNRPGACIEITLPATLLAPARRQAA